MKIKSIINFWLEPQIWSNLIFIFPAYLAITYGNTYESILFAFTPIVSIIYHSFTLEVDAQWFFLRENVSKLEFVSGVLDYICAFLILVIIIGRLIYGNLDTSTILLFITSFMASLIIFLGPNYFPFLRRWSVTATHSVWHILSGLVVAFALLM